MAKTPHGVIIVIAATLAAGPQRVALAQSGSRPGEGRQELATLVATQNAMAGVRIYRTKGCRKCHGPRTGPPQAPDLRSLQTARSIYELAAAMWNHLPGMRNAVYEEDAPGQRQREVYQSGRPDSNRRPPAPKADDGRAPALVDAGIRAASLPVRPAAPVGARGRWHC